MKQALLKLYAKIRKCMNPVKMPISTEWEIYKNLSMSAFSKRINSFPYKSDPVGGLFDHTASFEHFIDPTVKSGRDCDDFARMWLLWGMCNGYRAVEVLVTSKKHLFKDSHVVTVLYKDEKYILCNYRTYPATSSFVSALDYLKSWGTIYKDGYIYAIVD